MADKDAEKYLNYAQLAMQDRDYEDAKKNILKSLKLKTTEKGYKLLVECEAKIKAGGVRSRGNSNAHEPPIVTTPAPESKVLFPSPVPHVQS